MKVFISADIEGTNGITNWDETALHAHQRYFSDRMSAEVAAVCHGINSKNLDNYILVKDAHASARNIDHHLLPENVHLNRGWGGTPYSMTNGVQNDNFDIAIFTGYHNAAGTDTNPLAHTIDSSEIIYIKLNGEIASEFVMNRYACLYNKTPVAMISGDEGICKYAKTVDPAIVTVVTIIGNGNSVTSKHPNQTLKELEEAAKLALANKDKLSLEMPKTFEMEIYYKNHTTAKRQSHYPNAYQIDAHIVGFKSNDFMDVMTFFMFR